MHSDKVDGIESDRNLTRLVLLLRPEEDAEHLYKEIKQEEVQSEGETFVVKYQKAILCELGERWGNVKMQKPGDESILSQASGGIQQPGQVPFPLVRSQKETPAETEQFPNVWLARQIGPVSGYYHNIPPYLKGCGARQMQEYDEENSSSVVELEVSEKHHYGTISEEGKEKVEEQPTKIVVSNLPFSVHEDYLEMFFENTRKFGGGPVFNVEYDEESSSAVVEFEEPEAVDIVLDKRPIKMMGTAIEVDIYTPEEPLPSCTIEVTGPYSIVCEDQEDTLAMYFESKRRSGGGEVVDCRYDFENNMVLVTFESEEVAKRVEERASHIVMKERLQVKLHVPYKKSEKEEIEEPAPEPIKTVKVKGVDKATLKDMLEFYLENHRRSGGGEIKNIESDEEEEDVLYVTFTRAEEHHYGTISEEGKEKVEEQPTKIVVTNIPSFTDEDYLEMFFENTRKFGGGTVSNVEYDEESSSAVVEFEEPEAVDIVLDKRPIKMMGSVVEVDIYTPEEPLPRCTIEVTGPYSIVCEDQVETLAMYFESKRRSGGGEVVDIRFDFENNMVLVTFESEEVAKRVEERASHIFMNERLQVKLHVPYKKSKKKEEIEEPAPEPIKTVKVKGVDKGSSIDMLEFYFENRRRSGGGEIEKIESDKEEEDVLYVTFTRAEDAENVSKKTTHTVEGRTLRVSLCSCSRKRNTARRFNLDI